MPWEPAGRCHQDGETGALAQETGHSILAPHPAAGRQVKRDEWSTSRGLPELQQLEHWGAVKYEALNSHLCFSLKLNIMPNKRE